VTRTAGGRPLDTLIRLFVVGNRFDEDMLAGVFAPTTVDEWCSFGILERCRGPGEGRHQHPVVRRPVRGGRHRGATGQWDARRRPRDGRQPSTLGLAGLTVRRPSRATLDLGAGGGYHALLAAAHSERWSRPTSRAGHLDGGPERRPKRTRSHRGPPGGSLRSRRGGDLRPRRVQPSFIVGPDISQQFLSTEREGDGLCRELARLAPSFLNEGGYCQFLANWISVDGQRWSDRLARGSRQWVRHLVIRISSDRPRTTMRPRDLGDDRRP